MARKEPDVEIRMESASEMGAGKRKKKRGRPAGEKAASPQEAARTGSEDLCRRERDWLERLAANPASFADVELEVHAQTRRWADSFVAGLLAKASERSEMAGHVERTLAEAEAPLRPVEKNGGR